MTRACLLFAAVLGSLAVLATHANADSVGTLQVKGTLYKRFGPVDCPAGTPATTNCFRDVPFRGDVVPGLGEVTFTPYTLYWDNFGSPCGHVHGQIPILVAGKGEIDLAFAVTGCWTGDAFPPAPVIVSGGSGRYAGASGSGTLEFHVASLTGPLSGSRQVTWTGTLDVAGVTFDTTPPQLAGAMSKVVKMRSAKGTRVRFSVSATDAIDGPVPAACVPRSGSLFRAGRTTVTCKSVDGSGNTASARFVITVKRVRR
jgi:hypothetical protein